MGALSINGVPALREPFEPLVPSVARVANTNSFRRPEGESEQEFAAFLRTSSSARSYARAPSTIAMVIMEPVQNSGGAFTAPAGYWAGVRASCATATASCCAPTR